MQGKEYAMPIQTRNLAKYPVKAATEVLPLVLNSKEVVFADIETTGFGQFHDITEIGAVKVDVERGIVLDKFETFVHLKQRKSVPAKITELTHIATSDVANAPRLELVLRAFQSFIGTSVLSFHNASFDWSMLQQRYQLIGHSLTNEVICTVKLFRYLHPSQPSNLDAVTAFYGVPIKGHHRAYTDCKWTAACYCKMRSELIELVHSGQLTVSSNSIPENGSVTTLSSQDVFNSCSIRRITGWKKGERERIYVSTNLADFYYDMTEQVWNISKKKTTNNIDVQFLAQFVLEQTQMKTDQFVATYSCKPTVL